MAESVAEGLLQVEKATPAFAVADLWAEWPVHDAAVDLVVSLFALLSAVPLFTIGAYTVTLAEVPFKVVGRGKLAAY